MKTLLTFIAIWAAAPSFAAEAPLKALDPAMEIAPFNINDSTKLFLATSKLQIKKIRANEKLTDEEKNRQVALVQEMQKQMLLATDILREYSPLIGALNVCGGGELSLGVLVPDALEYITPGAQGELCLTFALSRDGGSGGLNLPTVGVSFLVGGQGQRPEKTAEGKPVAGLIEPQFIISAMIPLSQTTPISRVGDLQGYYAGGTVGWALETNSKVMDNFKTGAVSPYVKVDGFKRPDVLMINITKTRTQQNHALRLQGEVFYFGSPYASDGTQLMLPNLLAKLFRVPENSPHRLENRLERFNKSELHEVLENAEVQQLLRPENAQKLLDDAQHELRRRTETAPQASPVIPAIETPKTAPATPKTPTETPASPPELQVPTIEIPEGPGTPTPPPAE